jgi:hypothetical protein
MNAAVRWLAVAVLALGVTWSLPGPGLGEATGAVQSMLYFGLKSDDGSGVSEQEWAAFLAEIVTPRFPDGLTVLDAYGQSRGSGAEPDAIKAQLTKVLIVVHGSTPEAATALAEIKAEYRRRFAKSRVFHTETPVIVEE